MPLKRSLISCGLTSETGLPLELLHKLIGEMKSEAKDKNFNYKLFGESELENMKKYNHVNEEIRVDDLLDDIPIPEQMMEETPIDDSIDNMIDRIRESIGRLIPTNTIEMGDELP